MSRHVLLYAPQLIGYLRLLLTFLGWLLAAFVHPHAPPPHVGDHVFHAALACFLLCIALDAADGWAARALGQTSAVGALLDVWTDNVTRGLLWVMGAPHGAGLWPVVLEMSTFLVTHKTGGAAWKTGCFTRAPRWVTWVMAANFCTPQGTLVIGGLMFLPLWVWVKSVRPASLLASWPLLVVLVAGRVLGACVEVWLIARYLAAVVREDVAAARTRQQQQQQQGEKSK